MNRSPIKNGKPFSEERTREIIRDFKREGFVLIPNVLEQDEMEALREKTDELFDNPEMIQSGHLRENHFILWHLNELDRTFCDMLVREPIISLMEAIFGPDCQQCGMNVLRTDHTNAIDR